MEAVDQKVRNLQQATMLQYTLNTTPFVLLARSVLAVANQPPSTVAVRKNVAIHMARMSNSTTSHAITAGGISIRWSACCVY